MTRPIVVLADDLTGATELAGVALRFGLRAKVVTQPARVSAAADGDHAVVCYDTDTRRLSAEEAARRTYAFAEAIAADQTCLYKKTDSLLRGHPAAEIEALLRFPLWRRALLCPANPGRGRTIQGGDYYVDGTLLAFSSLADDPEHPRTSSNVNTLLDAPRAAIEVPDVATADDLRRHASHVTSDVLPAGGAEFFAALLEQRGCSVQAAIEPISPSALPTPWCFVCGSRTGWQQGRQREALANDVPCLLVSTLEPLAFQRDLETHGAVWIAIGEPAQQAPASYWLELLASNVSRCVRATRIGTLFLEGGATARAVLDRCGWTRFDAVSELAPGCVAMRADNPAAPLLVTKPGSYSWPDRLWKSRGQQKASLPSPPFVERGRGEGS